MRDTPLHVLHVDLSKKRFWVEDRGDLFDQRIGGTGVAINLLKEECPKGVDPFSPENPIVFAVGPFTGLYPMASKSVAMFKSPLTGNLGESHCGGRSAVAIRLAGYGAIVVRGASETPIYLAVHDNRMHFRDASAIWNMASGYTVGRILREREPGAGIRSIMRIGKAGEKLVSYAGVMTETYRHFGRLGLGAIFGSKKLKAMVISGRSSIPVADRKAYRETYNAIFHQCLSDEMRKYHDLGTAMNVNPLNELGALPAKNLTQARLEGGEEISGETFAQNLLGRRAACLHCPVSCIHLAALREPYESEPYFYKTKMICYDYEPIYALGSMLGVTVPESLLRLIDQVETFGLDAMSTGVVLAWATEAQKKGLISTRETAGLELEWGDERAFLMAIRYITDRKNEFYEALGRGTEYASSVYGGKGFALAFGGNEMPGYHTGPAAHLGCLIGSRHSHLDSAGYSFDQSTKARVGTSGEMVDQLIGEEAWRQILSSLVVCLFARKIYGAELVAKAFRCLGQERTEEELGVRGAEILRAKYQFKVREGFSLGSLRIPERILETPTPHGRLSKEQLVNGLRLAEEKLHSLQCPHWR